MSSSYEITATTNSTTPLYNSTRPGEPPDIGAVVLFTVLIGIAIFVIVGNGLVLLSVFFVKKLRTRPNIVVVSLAVADILLGLVVLPFSAIMTTFERWIFGAILCNLIIVFDVFLCTASILNLFIISIERYIVIMHPLRAEEWLKPRRIMVAILLVWVISMISSFVPVLLGWNTSDGNVQNMRPTDNAELCKFESNIIYNTVLAVSTFFFPCVFMLISYLRILTVARRQAKKIEKTTHLYQRNSGDDVNQHGDRAKKTKQNFKKKSMSQSATSGQSKATITVATIVGCFLVCWFPYFCLYLIDPYIHYKEKLMSPIHEHSKFYNGLYSVFLWLGYTNSCLNPVIYSLLNRTFRTSFKQLLRCHCADLRNMFSENGGWTRGSISASMNRLSSSISARSINSAILSKFVRQRVPTVTFAFRKCKVDRSQQRTCCN